MKFNFSDLGNDIKGLGFTSITVIGDIHGMSNALSLAIQDSRDNNSFLISLGDIVDYGYDSVSCIEMMHDVAMNNKGLMVIGNHERKLLKYFKQRRDGEVKLQIKGGLISTVEQLDSLSGSEFNEVEQKFVELMKASYHHYVVGDYLFVHASSTEYMWEVHGSKLKGFHENRAVFGQIDPINRFKEDGYPNRIYDWVDNIPANKTVIVGHDIRSSEKMVIQQGKNGGTAIFLDTGCGKGGFLSSYVIDF